VFFLNGIKKNDIADVAYFEPYYLKNFIKASNKCIPRLKPWTMVLLALTKNHWYSE